MPGLVALKASIRGVADAARALALDAETSLFLVLDETGRLAVEYLQSLTRERRPPIRPGEAFRFAHPGHWADRSGILAANYFYAVQRHPPRLTIGNHDPGGYGAQLELRGAFYVVTGVMEPGAPVALALQAAIRRVAPEWQFGGWQ